jgi:hypothetical protein
METRKTGKRACTTFRSARVTDSASSAQPFLLHLDSS